MTTRLSERMADIIRRREEAVRKQAAKDENLKSDRAARDQLRQDVLNAWPDKCQLLQSALSEINAQLTSTDRPLYLVAEQKSDPSRVYRGRISYSKELFPFESGGFNKIVFVVSNDGRISFQIGTSGVFPKDNKALSIFHATEEEYTNIILDFIDLNTPRT